MLCAGGGLISLWLGDRRNVDGKQIPQSRYRTASRGQLPRGPNGLARALLWTLQQVADYLGTA
jgi:hypothetical protein